MSKTLEKVIIDADPGVDDAVAILTILGDPNVQVMAVTCVRGNSNITQTVLIKPKVLASSDIDLLSTPPANGWFGSDGFENLTLPTSLLDPNWIG
ncbi:hypothetical protein J6590_071657 [Homalodisca vitripennis]|nr:hypothetical protein J6590_071657 [Homalodisca vitripennis]